jgi:hypothetical protein
VSGKVKFWTEARVRKLEYCAQHGLTIPETSAVFNKSKMAIQYQACIRGLRFKKTHPGWTSEEDAILRDFVREGYGWTAIGEKMGKSRGAVAGYANRNNISFVGRPVEPKTSGNRLRSPEQPDARAKRKCLGCATEFDSRWVGNRLCKQCAGAAVRKSGAMA